MNSFEMVLYFIAGILVAYFSSLGQVLLKGAALKNRGFGPGVLLEKNVVACILLFFTSTVISVAVLTRMNYSVYNAISALNFVFIAIMSQRMLGELFDRQKLIGSAMIILGLALYALI